MSIRFKSPHLELELERSSPTLRMVLDDLNAVWPGDIVLTSVERTPQTRVVSAASGPAGTSPHEARPCRAADVRTRTLLPHQVQIAAMRVNEQWAYDPSRPAKKVALVESDHLHIQVHPATARRPPKPEVA